VRHYAPWRELSADEHAAVVVSGKQSNRTEPTRAGQS
jgi:hypothetical protein